MRAILAVVVIAVFASLVTAQSDRQLVERFDRAEAANKPKAALVAALEITERHPESSVWAFNAGRVHARLGQPEEALAQLSRSAELGYSGVASFTQHADLETLRGSDEFEAIVDTVRANAERRMAEFRAEAERHRPPTHVPSDLAESPPLVIALHGTGGTGRELLDRIRESADEVGVVVVAPDGLRPAGEGFSWTYRDEAEWFVERLIERAVAEHGVDPERVVLLGFSQGANVAMVMAQTHQETLVAVIPVCGHYEPNNTSSDEAPVRTYFLTGSRDRWKGTNVRGRKDFVGRGGEAALRTAPGVGHAVPKTEELVKALRWCLELE